LFTIYRGQNAANPYIQRTKKAAQGPLHLFHELLLYKSISVPYS
jgi:hypothetical protein